MGDIITIILVVAGATVFIVATAMIHAWKLNRIIKDPVGASFQVESLDLLEDVMSWRGRRKIERSVAKIEAEEQARTGTGGGDPPA